MFLWLWCTPSAAAPIPPLAWEVPYTTGVALKKKKKRKDKEAKQKLFTAKGESTGDSRLKVIPKNIDQVDKKIIPGKDLKCRKKIKINKMEV